MPNHNHSAAASATAGHSHDLFYYAYPKDIRSPYTWNSYSFVPTSHNMKASSGQPQSMLGGVGISSSGAGSVSVTINPSGSSQAHNNMQPYVSCYIWKRVF